jgi:hypothetical protein
MISCDCVAKSWMFLHNIYEEACTFYAKTTLCVGTYECNAVNELMVYLHFCRPAEEGSPRRRAEGL